MKRLFMLIVGGILFAAGYNYTRRQAEYVATQHTLVKTSQDQAPVVFPFKTLPSFVFRLDKSLSSATYN